MDTEYRTMYNVFDGAVYEDFAFYCTKKTISCGKIGFDRSPFYASGCTRTNGISITDTDFVPKNREPVCDQQRPAGKTGEV